MRRKEREITDKSEIDLIISSSDACRIAFANENIPYIVTLNFGYVRVDKPCLYFHCAPEGRKLDMLRKNNYVCFEMDANHKIYKGEKGCEWGMNFTSVLGYGRISVVDENEERIAGLCHIMDHYGGSGIYSFDKIVLARTIILRLDISEMTGKMK